VTTRALFNGSGDVSHYGLQFTATDKAAQISRMRSSPNLPKRSVSVPTDTLSTESRFTADRLGIGSSPGSSRTSLASPRIVVVHGAINARRSLGMAASRERTTTGRREISGTSHHHTSPLAGRSFKTKPPPRETTPSRPIRPTHQVDERGKRHTQRRSRLLDGGPPLRGQCLTTNPYRLARAGRRGIQMSSGHPACQDPKSWVLLAAFQRAIHPPSTVSTVPWM
jgi:hypothetical protein